MNVIETSIPGVLIIEPKVYRDARGYFFESFRKERYRALGIPTAFAQDNCSWSCRGTLRGLHFQEPQAQGKLVQIHSGSIFDVVVDLRANSPHFGTWVATQLSDQNFRQLWVPEGFAHGFCVTSDHALVTYKCTEPYAPDCDRAIAWNDPDLAIDWPINEPLLSPKDAAAPLLKDAAVLPLEEFE